MKNLKQIMFLLMLLNLSILLGQQKTITGLVIDDQGIPLPGATVVVVETGDGTTTDFDGNYTIGAEEGQTLAFSYVGYTTQEIAVGSASSYDITMQTGNALDEVVVTSLGIQRQKRQLTYATQNVETEGIDES